MISLFMPDSVNSENVSQEIIHELITCPKYCKNFKKRKAVDKGSNIELHYELSSINKRHDFVLLVRQNKKFEEDFSICLRYENTDRESALIFGCNCKHHGEPISQPLHGMFHTHTLSESDWRSNRRGNPNIRSQAPYSNYDEAIAFFLDYCKIADVSKFFPNESLKDKPNEKQLSIFDIPKERGDQNDNNLGGYD